MISQPPKQNKAVVLPGGLFPLDAPNAKVHPIYVCVEVRKLVPLLDAHLSIDWNGGLD